MGKLCAAFIFVFLPLFKTQWRTAGTAQFYRKKIRILWVDLYPAGFLPFRPRDAHFHHVHRMFYGSVGQVVVRMGLSTDGFYGNGIPKDRILD
jgi:hypothetical protein